MHRHAHIGPPGFAWSDGPSERGRLRRGVGQRGHSRVRQGTPAVAVATPSGGYSWRAAQRALSDCPTTITCRASHALPCPPRASGPGRPPVHDGRRSGDLAGRLYRARSFLSKSRWTIGLRCRRRSPPRQASSMPPPVWTLEACSGAVLAAPASFSAGDLIRRAPTPISRRCDQRCD